MADFALAPLENQFETQLVGEISSGATVPFNITVKKAISFTPQTDGFRIILEPGTSKEEGMIVTAVSGTTWTIGTRGVPKAKGGASTTTTHGGGATIIITDTWSTFDDMTTVMNTKADATVAETISGAWTHTNELDFSGTTIGGLRVNNLTTAQRDALASPANGMIIYNTTTGVHNQYIGGAWASFATGTVSNGSETVAGKWEGSTVAEQGTQSSTGGTGAGLVLQPKNLVKTGTFTPAFLTGGGSATSVIATWTAISDGTFTISIDGTKYNIIAVDFSGDTDMDDVAATIQAKMRTATSSTETVVWDTDHFIISSVDTTSSSAITVTSANGTGTDISGVGGTTFMDCDTGNGTVTEKVYDHVNKIVVMGTYGLDSENLESNYRGINTGTTDVTGTELETLTDGSDASSLHNHDICSLLNSGQRTIYLINNNLISTYGSGAVNDYGSGFKVNTGSTINSVASVYTSSPSNLGSIFDQDPKFFNTSKIQELTDQSITIGMGSASIFPTAGTTTMTIDHACFIISNSTLMASVANGSSQTQSPITGITLTVANKYFIEQNDSGHYLFYINGVLKATLTSNLPNNSISPTVQIRCNAAAIKSIISSNIIFTTS